MRHFVIAPSTDYFFGESLDEQKLLSSIGGSPIVCITDATVKRLYGENFAQQCGAHLLEIPLGEEGKTRQVKEWVEDQLIEKKYGSDVTLIALGGGAVCDLVGFIAATYHRGVPLVLVPTTIVAMVDASIGGKTGVNTPHGKNKIGAFYPARAVLANVKRLYTLPEREKLNGFAEIWKMGLIQGIDLSLPFEELLWSSIQAKSQIVEQDPRDQGVRRVLNFGHTVGHALEQASGYQCSHGEGVILGCLAESYTSFIMGYLPPSEWEAIQTLYQTLPSFPRLPSGYDRGRVLEAMHRDKKNVSGQVRMVLLEQRGSPLSFGGVFCAPVPFSLIEKALIWLENRHG